MTNKTFVSIEEQICNRYGIRKLSVDEEWSQPQAAKITRRNKMLTIDTCQHMRKLIDQIEFRMQTAPELDDAQHSKLVQEFADKVKEAYAATFNAAMFGRM